MAKVNKAQRIRAFAKWGKLCVYCTKNLFRNPTAYKGHSIDHLIPSADGGGNNWKNLVPSCAVCNGIKDDTDVHYTTLDSITGNPGFRFIENDTERATALRGAGAYITREKQRRSESLNEMLRAVDNYRENQPNQIR